MVVAEILRSRHLTKQRTSIGKLSPIKTFICRLVAFILSCFSHMYKLIGIVLKFMFQFQNGKFQFVGKMQIGEYKLPNVLLITSSVDR
jgi:hypothetical protein